MPIMTAVQDEMTPVFNELADILLGLVNAPRTEGNRIAGATMLRNAYQSGLLAGVELAAEGMQLATMLDAEDLANALPRAASEAEARFYAGPSVDLHDHPSPREAMAAAGWVPRDTTSSSPGHR